MPHRKKSEKKVDNKPSAGVIMMSDATYGRILESYFQKVTEKAFAEQIKYVYYGVGYDR